MSGYHSTDPSFYQAQAEGCRRLKQSVEESELCEALEALAIEHDQLACRFKDLRTAD